MWHIDWSWQLGPLIPLILLGPGVLPWLILLLLGPGVFPWLIGTLAGVGVRSKRMGTICAVSFAGGIGSWLLTLGWFLLSFVLPTIGLVHIWAGIIAIPLLIGVGLMAWAVLYSKRAARRAPD